ncbi:hypothetical protein [Streptomyces sp. NPDC059176]
MTAPGESHAARVPGTPLTAPHRRPGARPTYSAPTGLTACTTASQPTVR